MIFQFEYRAKKEAMSIIDAQEALGHRMVHNDYGDPCLLTFSDEDFAGTLEIPLTAQILAINGRLDALGLKIKALEEKTR